VLSQPFVYLFFGRLALQFFKQALAHVLLFVTSCIVQTSITVIHEKPSCLRPESVSLQPRPGGEKELHDIARQRVNIYLARSERGLYEEARPFALDYYLASFIMRVKINFGYQAFCGRARQA